MYLVDFLLSDIKLVYLVRPLCEVVLLFKTIFFSVKPAAMPSIGLAFPRATRAGWSCYLAAIPCTVLPPRSASSATAALNWSEKVRRFVIFLSTQSCWIHLRTLSEFARPVHMVKNKKINTPCKYARVRIFQLITWPLSYYRIDWQ